VTERLDREEAVRALTSLRGGDAVLFATEGVAAAVPFIGGFAAVALEQVRQRRDRRIAEFVVDWAIEMQKLADQIDRDFVRSARYADLLERSLDEMARVRQTEKRRYYATALANAATSTRPDDDEMALFLDALDQLLPVHLRLLAGIAAGPKPVSAPNEYFTVGTAAWAAISAAAPGMDTMVLQRCWEDLASIGIVESLINITVDPRTTTDLPHVITSFGHRFLEFVESSET
jgi:hypothetical protein